MNRRLASAFAAVILMALPALGPATALAAGGTSTGTSSTPAVPDTTNPFSPGVPISPATVPNTTSTPTTVQTTSSSSGSSGLSGSNAIEIALVAAVVLGGIAFFIWRDARRRAPVRTTADATAGLPGSASRGSKAPPKSRKLSQAERRRRKRGRAR